MKVSHFIPSDDFTQNLMIPSSKHQSLIFVRRHRNVSYQHDFHTTGDNALK